jgi:sodium-dependent dicarboxylate transporter 2/3/5
MRFDRARRRAGAVLAPLAFVLLWFWPPEGLAEAPARLAAIELMVVLAWITEVVPLWVPAVAGPALAAAIGITELSTAFAPFFHPLIMLFLGGFLLAAALSAQGVDRRAALWILARPSIDGRPTRALIAVAGVTFSFSMWISNTATTAMMVPIALGLCRNLHVDESQRSALERWTEGLLITLAYASSLGGLATPIGTAPNMLAIEHMHEKLARDVDFLQWMALALPVALVALTAVIGLSVRRFPPPAKRLEGLQDTVRAELAALGPADSGERRAIGVFALAVTLWVLPAILRLVLGDQHELTLMVRGNLKEGYSALACAALMLCLPHGTSRSDEGTRVLGMRRALRIDWGTLLLLGGSFSLGKLTFSTQLADYIGKGVLDWAPAGAFGLLLVSTTLVIYLTELTSNTATTSMMLPVLTPVAMAAGFDPLPMSIVIAMSASFAFMLPVSTPPNAIVYGTRAVRFMSMVRFGWWMDLIGLSLLLAVGAWWLPWILS